MTTEEIKKIFNQKKEKVNKQGKIIAGFRNTSFEDFFNWFDWDIFNEGCKYCGTTNEQSLYIYELQRNGTRPDATRCGKRGKRLELDRVDPNLPYDNLDNLVWCCYWCNNAKTNFFSHNEFTPIAQAIGAALRNILNEN